MRTSTARSQRSVRPRPDPLPRERLPGTKNSRIGPPNLKWLVGRVTPCAPGLANQRDGARGATRPTARFMGREQPSRVSGFANDGPADPGAGVLVRRQAFLPLRGERAGVSASVKPFPSLLLALVICVTGSFFTRAQNYSIDWHTIDGGGGTSTGGVYSVSGTIGQPDAGTMSGGSYSLAGGFWGIVNAIQTPGAPLLSIAQSNGTAVVFWPLPASGFVLDRTSALTGGPPSWTPVAFPYQTNATHIYITVPMPSGNNFYRLRKP